MPTSTPTSTPLPGQGEELLVYEWDGPVTEQEHGFPGELPPRANGDWIHPINYAGGTFYFWVEIREQPVAQNMRLQFCLWQEDNGYEYEIEGCGTKLGLQGTPGNIRHWSVKVSDLWFKDGNPVEWWRPRYRTAVVIKNENDLPVSDWENWNWSGENPEEWYPLDMHFIVIVVADGAVFSGWENYIEE